MIVLFCFAQALMINDTSPIVEFYPVEFDTDLNGKLQEWEAVVLIPFIDEVRTSPVSPNSAPTV